MLFIQYNLKVFNSYFCEMDYTNLKIQLVLIEAVFQNNVFLVYLELILKQTIFLDFKLM